MTRLRVKSPVEKTVSGAVLERRETELRTLHTANHVVVLRVGTLPNGIGWSVTANHTVRKGTYEMIPKAWYSFTALRLMRPSRLCCIPRRKRTMATLGEGCQGRRVRVSQ